MDLEQVYAGHTPNPTHEEVCSGMTGHNEVVRVIYDPTKVSYDELLRVFWGTTIRRKACGRATMRGRSTAGASIRMTPIRRMQMSKSAYAKSAYAKRRAEAGYGEITTAISTAISTAITTAITTAISTATSTAISTAITMASAFIAEDYHPQCRHVPVTAAGPVDELETRGASGS